MQELRDEIRIASKLSKLVILDCHSVDPQLREFSQEAILCVKSLDVAATSWLQPVYVAGLVLPDLQLEPRLRPSDIVLGCFGFALPWKNFHNVIRLGNRLGVRVKVITSIANATSHLEKVSTNYLSQLKKMSNNSVEVIEIFGRDSEIAAHLQDCSHVIFAEEFDGTVSASLRLAAMTGRPIIAVNTRQAREAGVVLINGLDEVTLNFLNDCAQARTIVRDGFEDYARVIGSYLLAPLYARIGHHDEIYEDVRQRERINWLRANCVGRIIDVGCASGYVTSYVGADLGVDSRIDRVSYATLRYPRIHFRLLDARNEVVGGFDTLVFGDIVEHMPFDEASKMINLWAKQSPKRILVTTPNAEKADFDPGIVETSEHRWMPTKEMVKHLAPDGYDHVLTTSSGSDFWLLKIDAPNSREQVLSPQTQQESKFAERTNG
jgi:SAM-dependent methyltransferase